MKAWRMAFRNGTGGQELWPQCQSYGLAVIAYAEMKFDLSKYPPQVAPKKWAHLSSPSQKYSLKAFAYGVKERHEIYVKEGSKIVGHGVVTRAYRFDRDCPVKDAGGGCWPHVIEVDWRPFSAVTVAVGDQQLYTVRPLRLEDLRKLKTASTEEAKQEEERSALEGEVEKREQKFRKRSRALILIKKRDSNYCCEVCHLRFDALYGEIGRDFIVAHHIELLYIRA